LSQQGKALLKILLSFFSMHINCFYLWLPLNSVSKIGCTSTNIIHMAGVQPFYPRSSKLFENWAAHNTSNWYV